MGHIGMVAPLTLLSILFLADNNFIFWIVALCANVPVLALNLAAQPTKITLPVLLVSLIINTTIMISSVIMSMV